MKSILTKKLIFKSSLPFLIVCSLISLVALVAVFQITDSTPYSISEQFTITMNLVGVGYRAAVQSQTLTLNLGYSHAVEMSIPTGISVAIQKNTTITLKGANKESLGLFASKIRSWRPPEPYKGKGILFEGELVKRKAGKSGKK